MRIDWLHIKEFKNLQDFTIDFDEEQLTTVLIGENGTGKSNLFEALVILFRDLHLGNTSALEYHIKYICRQHTIEIQANAPTKKQKDKASKHKYQITVDGEVVTFAHFNRNKERYLPKHVFAYYSGPSRRLLSHFDPHQKQFYDALLRGEDRPLRPLFYCRLVHSQFVLLAFYSEKEAVSREFLKQYLGITGLESVLFVLRKPSWAKSKPPKSIREQGDKRFWYSRGVVRDFLRRLWDVALAPIYNTESAQEDFRSQARKEERLYLFVKDEPALRTLAEIYPTPANFFNHLESTYISDLIREVRIKVQRVDMDGHLTFQELSEGEQQLLTVLGLLKFTKDEESLFLLDEPDTHLNPVWKLYYLNLLQEVVGDTPNSQLIIATHDPLTIAGLVRSQVQIFTRDADGVHVQSPEDHPRGLGVAGVLTQLFSLPSTLDHDTQKKLNDRDRLYAKEDRTPEEDQHLREMSDELAELGFTLSFRDPLYERFVRAVARRPEFQKPVLTKEEVERQEAIANEVLDELLAEEANDG